ncbi:MAG: sugar ABC transporter substrate-binding protein [Burkholderiales bacterium PBB3]|nr:MAG: sugar ABC transporter substrate-binding protein [Burkholderiales bacterium PBB3]
MACGQSSGPSITTQKAAGAASAPQAAKTEVGLVMKTLTNPFFVEMEKGARRAERDLGIKLVVKTAAQETSIEQQIQLIEDLIAARVGAIVIAPGDSQRLIPALKKAADAGIKLVNIDNRLAPEALSQAGIPPIPFIGVNNEAGAYKAAKFLAQGVSGPTDAVILEGIRSADNARKRLDGARRAWADNKNIRIVASVAANWEIDKAYEVTKALFATSPNIKLVFASNDMMAIGAVKYLQEAGKSGVKVMGYDALSEAIAEVSAGRMAGTVDQQAAEQGYQGVAFAVQLLKGASVAPMTTIETRLITASAHR